MFTHEFSINKSQKIINGQLYSVALDVCIDTNGEEIYLHDSNYFVIINDSYCGSALVPIKEEIRKWIESFVSDWKSTFYKYDVVEDLDAFTIALTNEINEKIETLFEKN